jgi:hypothetical protein
MRKFAAILFLIPVVLNAQLLQLGKAIVTSEGVNSADYTVHILETRKPENAVLGYDWPTTRTTHPDWVRGSNTNANGCQGCSGIGNVFGIAYDKSTPPNVFVAATNMYNSVFYGSGGAGAIYKLDKLNGAATRLTTTSSTFINHDSVVVRSIWNTGSGLGNICYGGGDNIMFATNFEDGKIYMINPTTGSVRSTYDPFEDDDKVPGYAPLGERIWGIAYYNNKLYFSRWVEDATRATQGLKNGIYSIELNTGNLSFPGTVNADGSFHDGNETLEIVAGTALIPNYPHNLSSYAGTTANYPNLNNITAPVSDIEFSSDGKMLVAERSMAEDKVISNFDFNSAHFSRVFEFENSGGQWQSTHNFFVGNIYANTNTAGGVDYGYGIAGCDSITKNIFADSSFLVYQQSGLKHLSNCEQLVWSTGDALRYPSYNPVGIISNYDNTIYGIAGISINGNSTRPNTSDWVKTASIYVDLDSVFNVSKARLGDVDIYRLSCSLDNCTATGVQNDETQIISAVYPNPAINQVVIEQKESNSLPLNVHIYNASGQLVKQEQKNERIATISLSGFASGMYFMKLMQGAKITTVKLSVIN